MTPAMSSKVLLLGRNGQVGTETCRLLQQQNWNFVALGREQCDLVKPGVRGLILDLRPQVIVNAAAYTAVDRAESEPELAYAVNVAAVQEIALAAREIGALLIHYSTDYVFDGHQERPWLEEDQTKPLNVYGRTKLQGEMAAISRGGASFIFRTSWVYGAQGKNFLRTMLRLGECSDKLSVVADQIGAPTWSRCLGELTLLTIERFLNARWQRRNRCGARVFRGVSRQLLGRDQLVRIRMRDLPRGCKTR